MLEINVAKDFTENPGGRYRDEGPFSGEEFRDRFLEIMVPEAVAMEQKIFIDFDGTYGCTNGFLEEAFGGFIRKHPEFCGLRDLLVIKSDDDENLEANVTVFINEEEKALQKGRD